MNSRFHCVVSIVLSLIFFGWATSDASAQRMRIFRRPAMQSAYRYSPAAKPTAKPVEEKKTEEKKTEEKKTEEKKTEEKKAETPAPAAQTPPVEEKKAEEKKADVPPVPATGETVHTAKKIEFSEEELAEVEKLRPEVQKGLIEIQQADSPEAVKHLCRTTLQGIRLTASEVHLLNKALARFLSDQEYIAITLLNRLRGNRPCLIDLALCEAARNHSQDMCSRRFFSHVSPNGWTFSSRAASQGASASAENIYMGSTSGVAAHNAWQNSPGHYSNMIGGHSRVGVGSVNGFFTQVFGR